MRKIVIAVVIGWVMLILFRVEGLAFLENAFTDQVITQTKEVDSRIKIVAIDEESISKIGDWPWSRDKVADLLDNLASDGAAAVWPNMLFIESSNPDQDRVLAEVVARYDNIYLPVSFNFEVIGKEREVLKEEYLKLPVVEIPMERIGHNNIFPEKDNVVRKIIPGIPTIDEEIVPNIDIMLANLLLPDEEKITWDNSYSWYRGEEQITVDENLKLGLTYSSSPTDPQFDIIPAWEVIDGEIDPSYFKDSVVLVGLYDKDQEELYGTPFSKKQMNSVEIHANSIQAFLDDSLYKKIQASYGALMVLVVGMFSFLIFAALRPALGAVLSGITIVGYTVFVIYYYNLSQLILPYSYMLLAILLAYGLSQLDRYLTKRKETLV